MSGRSTCSKVLHGRRISRVRLLFVEDFLALDARMADGVPAVGKGQDPGLKPAAPRKESTRQRGADSWHRRPCGPARRSRVVATRDRSDIQSSSRSLLPGANRPRGRSSPDSPACQWPISSPLVYDWQPNGCSATVLRHRPALRH